VCHRLQLLISVELISLTVFKFVRQTQIPESFRLRLRRRRNRRRQAGRRVRRLTGCLVVTKITTSMMLPTVMTRAPLRNVSSRRVSNDDERIAFDVTYSLSQKNPPCGFLTFFANSWEFLINFLHTYYTLPFTLHYKFLFSYLQL